ncbi:MAG: DUF2231 domain-containing protein [Methylacidiphilales bacterium]|nr:DUF2231 domain-containing protein [Candidatus Methylacidiphilales bacterium]
MTTDPNLWAKLHGASTHFPVALALSSVLFDSLAMAISNPERRMGLRAAGFYALILGVLGAFPAVISGLVMTRWDSLGSGPLLWHHCFVWPAFGLMVGLAVWRALARNQASSRVFAIYLALMILTAGLVAAAGYWGGELLLNG